MVIQSDLLHEKLVCVDTIRLSVAWLLYNTPPMMYTCTQSGCVVGWLIQTRDSYYIVYKVRDKHCSNLILMTLIKQLYIAHSTLHYD